MVQPRRSRLPPAQIARSEVAEDMTAREIAEAQRQARAMLYGHLPQMRAAEVLTPRR
jgi:hypothetical protein